MWKKREQRTHMWHPANTKHFWFILVKNHSGGQILSFLYLENLNTPFIGWLIFNTYLRAWHSSQKYHRQNEGWVTCIHITKRTTDESSAKLFLWKYPADLDTQAKASHWLLRDLVGDRVVDWSKVLIISIRYTITWFLKFELHDHIN